MDNNLLDCVSSLAVVSKTSKAGNQYNVLQVVFEGGYKQEFFLNSDASFIINSMLK